MQYVYCSTLILYALYGTTYFMHPKQNTTTKVDWRDFDGSMSDADLMSLSASFNSVNVTWMIYSQCHSYVWDTLLTWHLSADVLCNWKCYINTWNNIKKKNKYLLCQQQHKQTLTLHYEVTFMESTSTKIVMIKVILTTFTSAKEVV